ncbi:MAG: alpha/beta hydrolase [Oscillospiraceae bacterium]|nr:alpha/beta hydrolase [Oscillospiraceae bacterium]
MNKRVCGKISVEGDDLFYKITGSGEPLLMIPGGGGDGDLYLPLADLLSQRFKVITYDRRANSRSTMNDPTHFDIAQQARDAIAILNAASEKSACFFGNSSGAVIALEIASTFPQSLKFGIVHEPPLAKISPNKEKWMKFFDDCYKAAFKKGGASMASAKFLFGIEVPVMGMIGAQRKALKYLKDEPKDLDEKRIPSKDSNEFFIKQELISVISYEPNIENLKKVKDRLFIAAGDWSIKNNIWLAEVSKILAKEIGCEFISLPGHHGSFMDNPKEWTESLNKYLVRG